MLVESSEPESFIVEDEVEEFAIGSTGFKPGLKSPQLQSFWSPLSLCQDDLEDTDVAFEEGCLAIGEIEIPKSCHLFTQSKTSKVTPAFVQGRSPARQGFCVVRA